MPGDGDVVHPLVNRRDAHDAQQRIAQEHGIGLVDLVDADDPFVDGHALVARQPDDQAARDTANAGGIE